MFLLGLFVHNVAINSVAHLCSVASHCFVGLLVLSSGCGHRIIEAIFHFFLLLSTICATCILILSFLMFLLFSF